MEPMHELFTRRRVEFSDTDLAGVVHFSRFFIFMETAEDEFLRALGSGFTFDHEGRPGGWPKVAVSCEYLSPLRYGDEVEIHLKVLKMTRSTITYGLTMRCRNVDIARGQTTSVCCVHGPDGGLAPIAIPPPLAGRIGIAPR